MRTAIYPGTFDPITLGHADVIQKSLKLCDRLIVATTNTKNKNHFFPIDERIKVIKKDEKIKNGLNKFILSITENGFGKRSSFLEYRVTNRGGKGIIGIINSPRNGDVASTLVVEENDEIILSTDKGSVMRCAVKEIRSAGRNTQGVTIKKLSGSEKVVSAIKIEDNIN